MERAKVRGEMLSLFDWMCLFGSFLLAHLIRFGDIEFTSAELAVTMVFVLVCHLCLNLCGAYAQWRGTRIVHSVSRTVLAVGLAATVVVFLAFATRSGTSFSRVWFGIGVLGCVASLSLSRIAVHYHLTRLHKDARRRRRLVLAGAGSVGRSIVDKLAANPSLGIEVVGFFDDDATVTGSKQSGVPVWGTLDDMHSFIEKRRGSRESIDYAWLAIPPAAHERTVQLLASLSDTTVRVSVVPDYTQLAIYNCRLDAVLDIPLLDISNNQLTGSGVVLKEMFDRTCSACLVLLLLPLLCIIALAVKVDSRGPVLFAQRRYGMDGREIRVLKFRSMKVMEDGGSVVQATACDVRVTRVGRFLRRTSLDELPQLLNVLSGEMSLVGPRPHAVAHNELYRKQIGGYMMRHAIKPGITGLAQVSGCRGETSTIEAMKQRVELDRFYISNWSMALDVSILWKTVGALASNRSVY